MPASFGAPARPAMTGYWRLTPEITVAVSAARAVFLDIARDRYAMLPPLLNTPFVDWLDDPDHPAPGAWQAAVATRLGIEAGALQPAQPVSLAIPCTVPGRSLPRVRAGFLETLAVAAHVLRAKHRLAHGSLRANLERRGAALARHAHSAARRAIADKAAAYHAVRHLAPVPRVCLLDSLALIDWLGDALQSVQLVFGVTAYPFGAHCWVQTGEMLLGDPPDTIGRYAPILHLG